MWSANVLISGNIVPKKDVAETIQRFNIQVNNLTQVSLWPAIIILHGIRLVLHTVLICLV